MMCEIGAALAIVAMCLAVLNIILVSNRAANSAARLDLDSAPRYAVEFGQLVDDLAAQYVGVLSRGQVLDAALVAVTARLAAGPIPVGDAGGLPAPLRSSIIRAVDAAAEQAVRP